MKKDLTLVTVTLNCKNCQWLITHNIYNQQQVKIVCEKCGTEYKFETNISVKKARGKSHV